jgi:catechol 2,3-dioxygenase-like lactoylglutathione lyase family enzyme
MDVEGIEVVFLHSPRGRELAAWFARTLGVDIALEAGPWTELAIGGATRFAVDATGPAASDVERQAAVISFRVADLRAAVAELRALGVELYPPGGDDEHVIFRAGPSLVATFRDPDGTWHQLAERTDH